MGKAVGIDLGTTNSVVSEPEDHFDPTTQYAVASTEDTGTDPVVATLIRPGSRLGDQVLRAADVEDAAHTASSGVW